MARKTKIDLGELQDMLDAGIPVGDIAEELGVTSARISQLVTQLGLRGKVGRRSCLTELFPEDVESIVQRYISGVSVAELIYEYGLNYNAFYKLLRQNNVELRSRGKTELQYHQERMDIAVRMYINGARLHTIFSETGIHQPALHRELHRRDVPLRRPNYGRSRLQDVEDIDVDELGEVEKLLMPEEDFDD